MIKKSKWKYDGIRVEIKINIRMEIALKEMASVSNHSFLPVTATHN